MLSTKSIIKLEVNKSIPLIGKKGIKELTETESLYINNNLSKIQIKAKDNYMF
uniref:Uncharacterized protein n=1 Tax=viral metagenome TaxID=1070528 RepID=A0A6C0AER9_9ZZZZ